MRRWFDVKLHGVGKPRIRKFGAFWMCSRKTGNYVVVGETPAQAYKNWLEESDLLVRG